MSNNNDRFLSAYNRLDNYLQTLVKTSHRVNMIAYLESISPEKKRSEIKTVRLFKNTILSHGVNPHCKKPIIPEEWITWLLNELRWCKKNSAILAPKLQKAMETTNKGSKSTSSRYKDSSSSNSYTEYYRKMYGYKMYKPEPKTEQCSSSDHGYTFVSTHPKAGLFSKPLDGYGWVVCNHNGDFLEKTAYVYWSSSFRNAVVFKTEKEAKKTVDYFRKDSTTWGSSTPPFFRIRCVKMS